MAIQTFQRYEKKYLVTREQKEALEQIISLYMVKDAYCKNNNRYLIRNIYFDTSHRDIIHQSIAKPYHKEKIRIRKYGNYLHDRDEFFLEIKKKTGKIVSKRRVKLTEDELNCFLKNNQIPDKKDFISNQVLKEIQYFLSIYPIQPTAFISYERMAYFDKNDHEFRLTFDNHLLYRRENLDFSFHEDNLPLLDDKLYIMEVKIQQAMPYWLAHALSQLKIFPHSFSKYGEEYKLFLKEGEKENVCIHIAGIRN